MRAKQVSELQDVKFILYHEPHIIETIGYIHPLASLFENVPNYNKSRRAYKTFVDVLDKYNIHSAEVTEVLKRDKSVSSLVIQKLLELAKATSGYVGDEELVKENHRGLTDEYKNEVMSKLDVETLVGVVFSRPHLYLKKDRDGVSLTVDKIEINPLANMIFIRDQQIVTAKGLVIGNMMTTVRKFEKEVLKKCFEILNIKLAGIIPEGCYIEGGDFVTMSKDLAMMQIGIRSTIEGAKYLMDNDLLGTRYFGVVKDDKDRDQQRMHLDTIFNIIDEKNVILLDFDDAALPKNARRDIDIYEQKQPGGKYELIETLDFEKYLVKSGYNIIKASNKDQEQFMINFANIGKFDGKYVLVTSNAKFDSVMKERNINVTVEYIPEFKEVNKMHGSFHCVTQIFR